MAIDGVDGAGKTVLGRELADKVGASRAVHRVSVDGFHQVRERRYAGGRTADGYYRNAFDHVAIREQLVQPFRAGKPWASAVHDVAREVVIDAPPKPPAVEASLLIVDGVFLQRPELVDLWDAVVWVQVPFDVSVPRGNARFGPVGASEADPESEVNARYVGAQRLYIAEVDPAARADWVLDNADVDAPRLVPAEPLSAGAG